jgi:hypothetical protein
MTAIIVPFTPDQVAIVVREIDPDSAQALTATFGAMIAQAEEWAKQASLIRVTDIGQTHQMRLARESRLGLRAIRINVENARKRLKADSLRRGQAIDAVANMIKARIEPIEAVLLEQEEFAVRYEAAQRQIEEAKAAEVVRLEQERLAAVQREEERVARERADLERSERETAQRAENERLRREALEREAAAKVERERVEAERKAERAQVDERLRQERAEREAADNLARKERLDREAAERAREAAEAEALAEKNRREYVEADLLIASAPKPANESTPAEPEDVPRAAAAPRRHLTVRSDQAFLGITASAIDRSIACSGWTAFPHVYRTSDYAERGNAIHRYVRAVLAGTAQEAAILAVPEEHREVCRQLDWGKLCGDLDDVQTEAAFALNVVTRKARFLGFNIGRKYAAAAERMGEPLTEDDVCGSLDVKGLRKSDGRPTIRDLKSGFVDVTAASKNGQVKFFAAVEHLMTGAPEVDSEIAKLKPNGDLWFDRATFSAWEVDDYLDELEDTVERHKKAKRVYLAGGLPDVAPTEDGCRYCPAFDVCPAYAALARAMLGDVQAMDRVGVDPLTVEEAGEVMDRAYLIRPVLTRVIDAGKERAKREAMPMKAGKELRPIEYTRNDISSDAILALARQLGATDEQVRECYRSSNVVQVRVLNAPGASKSKRRAD